MAAWNTLYPQDRIPPVTRIQTENTTIAIPPAAIPSQLQPEKDSNEVEQHDSDMQTNPGFDPPVVGDPGMIRS